MKTIVIITAGFAALAQAATHQLPRYIGDKCKVPQETIVGTCQTPSTCNGALYPDLRCPKVDAAYGGCCIPFTDAADPPIHRSLLPFLSSRASGSCSSPAPNTCTFYPSCLEKTLNCGSSGYPLAYGLKYCNKFSSASSSMSSAGQEWVTDTMLCLQRALVPYATGAKHPGSCANLKDIAFSSHPGCYVNGGVCTLPPADWTIIFKTVGVKELFGSWDAVVQTVRTLGGCAELLAWLALEKIQELNPFD